MVEHQFEERVQELTALPAGRELSAALHDLDPATMPARDLPAALAAARRQLSADTARFATLAHELGLADIGEPGQRGETLDEYAADEVRAVLAISRTAAWTLLHRAEDTRHRLPHLGDAWSEGTIDEDRVRTFCTWTQALSDEHARRVVAVVLPDAPRMTQRALITRIREVATALDPDWARKLYENSVRQRRLRARMTEQGTGNLSGLDLPLDDVARSVAHITLLAAKAKALGHPGLIDTVRADVFLALLSPELAGADDDTLLAAVLRRAHPDDPTDHEVPDPDQAPPDDPGPAAEPGPGDEPGPGSPGRGGNGITGAEPDQQPSDDESEPRASGDASEPRAAGDASEPRAAGEESEPGADPHADAEQQAEQQAEAEADGEVPEAPFEPEQTRRRQGPRQARLELRVGLATLLGLDDKPARLQGWGIVHAELARLITRDHTGGEWRVAVTDHTGVLTAALVTRRRPHGYRTTPQHDSDDTRRCDDTRYVARPVVELHVTEEFLDNLDPAAHPGWARVIADLQQQLALWRAARAHSATDIADDSAAWREALARFPTAALARWIEMRDRGCVFPTCGATAIACDLDHTLAVVAAGGLTVAGNLDPLCGHDHGAKHQGGWHLAQPGPGCFTWTSPTGHTYTRDPQSPLPDLPDPRPPEQQWQRSHTEPPGYADPHHGPVWDNEPYPAPPPEPPTPPPPAAAAQDDDDPPF